MKQLPVLLLFFAIEIRAQSFSFSTELGQRAPRQFGTRGFGGRQVQSSSSSSSASSGGITSSSASASSRPATTSSIEPALQQQFADIFDWNKDLRDDPRFRSCSVPDIANVARACPKRAFYYGLNPQHRDAVGMVKQILTSPRSAQQTVCLAGAMRDLPGMNPNVWIRGMLGAHLSDVGLFDLEVMPHIFISNEFIQQAKQQGSVNPNTRQCITVDGRVGADNGIENRLWYWREDLQVNSFHLSWHLVYPFMGVNNMKADRQGELFYFSHRSHLARYHSERLSNGLGPVVPLNLNYNIPVPGSYNPHLSDTNSALNWTPRRANRVAQDVIVNIPGIPPNISVADRNLHIQRVEDAIRSRAFLLQNGQQSPINERSGIDILGDVIEASIFSPNPEYYGRFGFHNEGHVLLGLLEDPRNVSNIPPGVMIETATAMRDPIFYNYHEAMDSTFELHKQQLPPYQPESGDLRLKWDGISIDGLEVIPQDGVKNRLTTFFNQRTFELTRGLDFNRSGVQGAVSACVTHLDHNPFTYRMYVNRRPESQTGRATVRIFLAPRFNERGSRYSMVEQRKHFFMLDMFTVQLQMGFNRIQRLSSDSSLTISLPQSLSTTGKGKEERVKERPRTYCGCGWPHHLLIPRGNEQGLQFDLFVMLTNGDEDYVPPITNSRRPGECKPAPIYCGRLNDTYPDARPMGYPFDRLPYNSQSSGRSKFVSNLEEYTKGIPNMASVPVLIQHFGDQRGGGGGGGRSPSINFGTDGTRGSGGGGQTTVNFYNQGNPGNVQTTGGIRFDQNVRPVNVPLLHQEHESYEDSSSGDEDHHPHHDHDHDHDHSHGSSNRYNYKDTGFFGYPYYTRAAFFMDKTHQYVYAA